MARMNENYIIVATFLSSFLSAIGCTMMVSYYVYFPADRAVAHVFCLWLGICGICLSATTFFVVDEIKSGSFLCTFFPMVEDYFILCASFTTVVIAIRIKKIVFQHDGCLNLPDETLRFYFAIVWGGPLVLVLLPLTTNSYGRNDGDHYCFIKHDRDGKDKENMIAKVWILSAFYGPVLFCMFIIIGIYSQCVRQIRIMQRDSGVVRSSLESMIRKILAYPLIFIVVLLIPVWHRSRTVVGLQNPKWMDMLAYNSWKIQGFLDTIAYGSSTNMYTTYAKFIKGKLTLLIPRTRPLDTHGEFNIEVSTFESSAVVVTNTLHSNSSQFSLRGSEESMSFN